MSALALQTARRDLLASAAPALALADPGLIVQRKSTFGPEPVMAPPIRDAGRPLDADTRDVMEAGFGRSFADVRVHDDARAHDNARALDARAYAAGQDIVFGEGAYRPETSAGRALIAHELAHTVQQGGVQLKALGALPAFANAELEAQADRAAGEVLAGQPAPALSTVGSPGVFRNPVGDPAPAAPSTTAVAGPPQKLPPGMKEIKDPERPDSLIVEVAQFTLPLEKGAGDWVQKAYTDAGNGGRLVFSPLFNGNSVAAYKEGKEDYLSIWLGKYGFTTTQGLAAAFQLAKAKNENVKKAAEDAGVTALIAGMATNLKQSKCDIDHIVEKQMGGTSMVSNLQLLVSTKNQSSGTQTYHALVELVNQLRAPGMRGEGPKSIQLRLRAATVPAGTPDPSYIVEKLLRDGDLQGKDEVKAKAEGKPVYLEAGGQGETVNVHDTNPTPIDAMAKRIVPGMRITTYKRGPGGTRSARDEVSGQLDSRAMRATGADEAESKVVLVATPSKAPGAPAAATTPDGSPAPAEVAPAGERRSLSIPAGPKKIKFYYPYLSPGTISVLGMDEAGGLKGEGVINSSVKFLGDLKVRFGKDMFELVQDIDVAQINKSAFMQRMAGSFRFTEGALKIDLLKFVPGGLMKFSLGPATKPYVLGEITARAEGGAFIATGKLTPAGTLPGIKDAAGEVSYHSDKGWSGLLKATTSAIPGATTNLELGFAEAGSKIDFHAKGGITTQIRDVSLYLGAHWGDGGLVLAGDATIPKPLPLVESVKLQGGYGGGVLSLKGTPKAKWRGVEAEATVHYNRKDGDAEGRFSGLVTFSYKDEKMDGSVTLTLGEKGYSGKGEIAYQVSKHFRPRLTAELLPTGKIKLGGTVTLNDIKVFDGWPKPPDDRKTLLKASARTQIPIPPMPAITVTLAATGELGAFYSVGPGVITGVSLTASLFPFEEDKQITAKLTGKFAVPAKAGLYGRFGVLIGAAVGGGLVGAEGGVYLVPEIGVKGEGGIDVNADYSDGGFSFEAAAYAKGAMFGSLGIDFAVNLYAAYGLVSHEWTFPAAKWGPKTIGPELDITLGKFAYARDGTITWPNLSQIDVKPKEFDPLALVQDIMGSSKVAEKKNG